MIHSFVKSKLETSCCFRGLANAFRILFFNLFSEARTPSRNTIRLWVQKIGYYELTRTKEISDDWIIILDMSVGVGQEKILLIYGVRKKNLSFEEALKYSNLETLKVLVRKSWSADDVTLVLKDLEKEIGTIIYAVSDSGANIKKALLNQGLKHVPDITHVIASITKKMFKDNQIYSEISSEMCKMRNDLFQTEGACIVPPNQRHKSHYQNLKRYSDYLVSLLEYVKKKKYKKTLLKRKEKIIWIKEYELFIRELSELNDVISKIEKIIKINGLSNKTANECKKIMKENKNQYVKILEIKLKEYFVEVLSSFPNEKILCTSDIIESAFGKYKNYLSQNPLAGVTNLCLSLAAFTSNLSKENIKLALEKTTVKDIESWTFENIGTSLHQMRCQAFSYT